MASKSNLQVVQQSIEVLTESELKQVIDKASKLRRTLLLNQPGRPSLSYLPSARSVSASSGPNLKSTARTSAAGSSTPPLLGLPIEVQFMIYELIITPSVIEAHIKNNKVPELLKVSHEVRDNFAAYYYGEKFFSVELLEHETGSWTLVDKKETPRVVRAMFEEWTGCGVTYDFQCIKTWKKWKAQEREDCQLAGLPSYDGGSAIVRWVGGPEGQGLHAQFSPRGRPDLKSTRWAFYLLDKLCDQRLKRKDI